MINYICEAMNMDHMTVTLLFNPSPEPQQNRKNLTASYILNRTQNQCLGEGQLSPATVHLEFTAFIKVLLTPLNVPITPVVIHLCSSSVSP